MVIFLLENKEVVRMYLPRGMEEVKGIY